MCKNIAHANDGGHGPPPLDPPLTVIQLFNRQLQTHNVIYGCLHYFQQNYVLFMNCLI